MFKWVTGIFAVFVAGLIGSVYYLGNDNTQGTSNSAASLPFLAEPLKDLRCEGEVAWHLHRDHLVNRYTYTVSGTISKANLDAFATKHHVHELEAAIYSTGTWPKIEYLKRVQPRILTEFDKGDSVYLSRDKDPVLGNVELAFRLRDGKFTAQLWN